MEKWFLKQPGVGTVHCLDDLIETEASSLLYFVKSEKLFNEFLTKFSACWLKFSWLLARLTSFEQWTDCFTIGFKCNYSIY